MQPEPFNRLGVKTVSLNLLPKRSFPWKQSGTVARHALHEATTNRKENGSENPSECMALHSVWPSYRLSRSHGS